MALLDLHKRFGRIMGLTKKKERGFSKPIRTIETILTKGKQGSGDLLITLEDAHFEYRNKLLYRQVERGSKVEVTRGHHYEETYDYEGSDFSKKVVVERFDFPEEIVGVLPSNGTLSSANLSLGNGKDYRL